MSTRVSYIVATRNRASFVKAALPMWAGLKGADDELIVVDGNSSDGTHEILQSAPAGLIDRLVHEPDRSEAHAFNKGFLLARGSLIKLLTDDDELFRDGLETSYEALSARTEIDVLVTGGDVVSRVQDPRSEAVTHRYWFEDDYFVREPCDRIRLSGVGMMIRRSSLAITGLIDPRHVNADTSFLTQATVRGATIRYIRVRGFRQYLYPHSLGLLNQRRATYIYRDLNFHGLSRWRYLLRPGRGLREILKRLGLRSRFSAHEGAAWDGKIL